MREEDLTETLLAAQQAMVIDALVKIQLYGEFSYTYERDRILDINHPEEPYSQKATVVLDNSDGALTNIALQGFMGVISYGAVASGNEYSACAPLWVIGQQFNSSPGVLDCTLELIGIPNLMAEDKASKNYIPDADDTKTVLTLIREIAGDSGVTHLSCYSHCKKYDVVFDSEDALINTYKPKNGFRIYKNNNRLAVIRRLLDCTQCVMIAKADGKLHVFVPQITGTPVYTYSLETGHTFFASANRKTIIIPNYIYASSPPPTVPNWVIVTSDPYSGEAKDQTDIDKFGDRKHTTDFGAGNLASDAECASYAELELARYTALHDPYYEGTASDQDSIDAIGEIRAYQQGSFENDAQAQQVAEAILAKGKLNAEIGAASVPMNVGQEVYDYINVVDTRLVKERAGTIGRLTRHYNALKGEWQMSFSFGQRAEAAVDIMPIVEQAAPYFGRLIVDNLYAQNILADSLNMVWIDPDNTIDLSKIGDNLDNLPDGEVFARVKTLHLSAEGGIKLDENILYKVGFDPNTKRRNFATTPTTPYDLGDLWHDANVAKFCTTARATGAYVAGDWTQVPLDAIADGVTYQKVLATHIDAGKIKLTSEATIVGQWYKQSGVLLHADYGIKLYGGQISLKTYPTLADAEADTNVQCFVGTDGKIYAGAGGVVLDASGIEIRGTTTLKLTYYGAYTGYIYTSSTGNLIIAPATGYNIYPFGTIESQHIQPQSHDAYACGYSDKRWLQLWAKYLYGYSVGLPASHWDFGYIRGIFPDGINVGQCGASDDYWQQVCSYYLFLKDTTIYGFQKHDDIALLKAIKPRRHKGRDVIDANSLPPDLLMPGDKGDKHGKFVNMAGLAGFNIGVMRQIVERLEKLEAKVGG